MAPDNPHVSAAPEPGRGAAGIGAAPGSTRFYEISVREKMLNSVNRAGVVEIRLMRPIVPSEGPVIARDVFVRVKDKPWLVAVISGRMPMWLMAMILHEIYHSFPVTAVYDPKQRGAVVVASHVTSIGEGEVIEI